MQTNQLPTWLTDRFNRDDCDLPDVVRAYQNKNRTALLQHGLPQPKAERWKYTDLTFLQKEEFICSEASLNLQIKNATDFAEQPIIVCNLRSAFVAHPNLVHAYLLREIDLQDYPFASINASLLGDGLFIYVPADYKCALPIHVLSNSREMNTLSQAHCVIVLEANSELTLIEEYHGQGTYLTNVLHRVFLKENAKLNYYKLQNESNDARHTDTLFVEQSAHSALSYVTISLGSQFARDETIINLNGEAASCQTAGFYQLTRDQQYIDHHIAVNHNAAHSRSDLIYKGILSQRSRAVFNGRLHVTEQAQKIKAHQANHTLLLTDQAEMYSKPELEIYADDVQCKHGATMGQLDEDALFYLRARGIPKEEAVRMLIQSFAAEIIDAIKNNVFKERMKERLSDES